jgi:hypothetical protein
MARAEGIASLCHLLGVQVQTGQGAVPSPALRRIWTFASLAGTLLDHAVAPPAMTPHDSLWLLRTVLPQDTLPTPLLQALLARAAGHPLFLTPSVEYS